MITAGPGGVGMGAPGMAPGMGAPQPGYGAQPGMYAQPGYAPQPGMQPGGYPGMPM